VSAAIAGYPNSTVPMGQVRGLPAGISIFGKAWNEPTLISIAYAYQHGTRHRTPPTFAATLSWQRRCPAELDRGVDRVAHRCDLCR
jgi:hypothetical protein